MNSIIVTPKAIDEASNRVRGIWAQNRRAAAYPGAEAEGLYSWLLRTAFEAVRFGERLASGKYRYATMKFTIIPAAVSPNKPNQISGILQGVERV